MKETPNPSSTANTLEESDVRVFWKKLRWGLPFMAALLPIVLLGLYALRAAGASVEDFVETGNVSASMNVAEYVNQEFTRGIDLVRAVASVPSTLEAVRAHDEIALGARLKAIVLAYPQVDRAFVTDRRGVLWADYPQAPDAFGRSQAADDWYLGISQRWKPYICDVYVRSFNPDVPVFAIAMPIYDEAGGVLGALVTEHRTDQMLRWLQNVRIGNSGYVFIVDHGGTVVAHPRLSSVGKLHEEYASLDGIKSVRESGSIERGAYIDPESGQEMLASFLSLSAAQNHWVVVGGQPKQEALLPLHRLTWNLGLAAVILTLFTLGMVVALAYSRRHIERLNNALAEKNQTLRDITSFVSHQLRAPVTAMRWVIESMLDGDFGKVGATLRKELESLKDVAIQNGELINDILNVSRIDRGVIEVDVKETTLQEITERALRDYRVPIKEAGLKLVVRGGTQQIAVLADMEKTAEAVTNSISNALKHTKSGSLTVTMRHDEQLGYIDVTDTGEGMTEDVMSLLFSRTGITGKNTDSSQSTGLGLYIARTFMQMQKGDITVQSSPGEGSTFTYSLPLASAKKEGDDRGKQS